MIPISDALGVFLVHPVGFPIVVTAVCCLALRVCKNIPIS